MSPLEIAWLAGILEGEGSFGFYNRSPRIWIGMADEDIIDRVRRLLNLGQKIHRKKPSPLSTKPCFVISVTGHKAVGAMMTIYNFMGTRRRAKIREVLASWRALPLGFHRGVGQRTYNDSARPGVATQKGNTDERATELCRGY
jgi:hypothetical protein